MKDIRILTIGKPKTSFHREAAEHYLQRLSHFGRVEVTHIKDADPKLPPPQRRVWEGARLLERLPSGREIICLDETGKTLSSEAFAHLLQRLEDAARPPCFIVGGPYGLDDAVRAKADRVLSFSPMTMTHEAALVFLLEQLYRARNILAGTGYHH